MTMRKPSSIHDLLEKEYGTSFIIREDPYGVGDADSASKQLFPSDPARIAFYFINLSTGVMYLRPSQLAASATAGIRIDSSGGDLFVAWRDDGILPSFEWQVIGDDNNLAFFVLEYRVPVD